MESTMPHNWTITVDLQEKKRAQNRIAQRNHRQRIKDRIANLQLELDKSENKRKKLEGAQAPSDSEQDGESIPFPAAMEENSVWNFGLISPGETVTSSQDAGCIRNQHGEGSVITPDESCILETTTAHDAFISQKEAPDGIAGYMEPFALSSFTDLLQSVNHPLEMDHKSDQATSSGSGSSTDGRALSSCYDPSEPNAAAPSRENVSLEERIQSIMQCANANGFENFDRLAISYYTEAFMPSSRLAHEQRLSRSRRLAPVLSALSDASRQWSPAERQAFCDEMVKNTEAILDSEGEKAKSGVIGADLMASLLTAQEHNPTTFSAVVLDVFRSNAPNELPNRWALMMALAASESPTWQRDSSSTVLAAMLIFHFAGRIDKERLLTLVRACL